MVEINDVAALLHVEEKLRAHGNRYPNMLKAILAKLDEHEAAHAPAKEPEPEVEQPVEEPVEETVEEPTTARRL